MFMPNFGSNKTYFFKGFHVPEDRIKNLLGCFGGPIVRHELEFPGATQDGTEFTWAVVIHSTENKDKNTQAALLSIFRKFSNTEIEYHTQIATTNDPTALDHFTRARGFQPMTGRAVAKCMEQTCFCESKFKASTSGPMTPDMFRNVALTSKFMQASCLCEILGPVAAHVERPAVVFDEQAAAEKIQEKQEQAKRLKLEDGTPAPVPSFEKLMEEARKEAEKEADKKWLVLLREVVAGMSDDEFTALYKAFAEKMMSLPIDFSPIKYKMAGRSALFTQELVNEYDKLAFLRVIFARAEMLDPAVNPIEAFMFLACPLFCHEFSLDDEKWAIMFKKGMKLHDLVFTPEGKVNEQGIKSLIPFVEKANAKQDDYISRLVELAKDQSAAGDDLVFEHLTKGTLSIGSLLGTGVQILRMVYFDKLSLSDGVMARIESEFKRFGIDVQDFRLHKRGLELEEAGIAASDLYGEMLGVGVSVKTV